MTVGGGSNPGFFSFFFYLMSHNVLLGCGGY
uniref:Uncharacterized protein n=1 Tax=Setaria italica TaxID=4555 RepID=K3YNR8_SETIT